MPQRIFLGRRALLVSSYLIPGGLLQIKGLFACLEVPSNMSGFGIRVALLRF